MIQESPSAAYSKNMLRKHPSFPEHKQRLAKDDLVIDHSVPHIKVKPYLWRSLKTVGSEREVPLIGISLWAAKRIKNNESPFKFAFPRYTNDHFSNANSASAALNKWLKPFVPENCVIHSFRHSFRDRLRNVE